MSALTAAPSPAPSPRARDLSQFGVARKSSQSSLCQSPAYPKPRSHSPDQFPHYSPRFRPAPRSHTRPQYADAGVQCSRGGSSPTARRDMTSNVPSARNKRKGTPSSPPLKTNAGPSTVTTEASADAKSGNEPRAAAQSREADLTQRMAASHVSAEPRATNAPASAKRLRTGAAALKMVPQRYETCDPKDLGVLIANMLMELIRLNDPIPLKDGKLTRFHSRAPPGISCHDYLLRLIQHATLSPPILLSMVFYIDRLCTMYTSFTISSLTVHRFLITAATVASKGLSDSFWTNPTYARIGGISTSELATLEMDFLQRMEWRIVPKPETLTDYYRSLVQRSEGYELEPESEDDDEDDDSDAMDDDSTK